MERRVAFARVDAGDIEAAVRRAIDLDGGLAHLIDSSTRVLVKPNLWSPQPSGTGSVTDSRVTEAVTKVVLEHGPRTVVIGDGCGAGYDGYSHSTEEAFELSGTKDAADRLGVELRNLNSDDSQEVEIPGALIMDRVRVCRTALDSDVIISIPVLKTHIRTDVTLSLKNMKGVIPGVEKRKTHRLGLDQAIVDLNSVVGPHYVVLDATMGMQGLWHYPDDCVEVGLIGAGSHALSVDIAAATIMGIDPHEVLHLRHRAEQEGLPSTLEGVHLVGEDIRAYQKHFRTAFQVFSERFPQVNVVRGESACTGCTNELVTALRYLDESGYSPEMGDLTIVIGEVESVPEAEKLALLGKCARMHSSLGVHAPGCPPTEESVIRALCAACGADPVTVLETRDRARERMWGETSSKLAS